MQRSKVCNANMSNAEVGVAVRRQHVLGLKRRIALKSVCSDEYHADRQVLL